MISDYFAQSRPQALGAQPPATTSVSGSAARTRKRPAAAAVKRPAATAGGGVARPRVANTTSFTPHSGFSAACKRWETTTRSVVRGSPLPSLTGRVLITVVDRATPLTFCTEDGVMTVTGCSMQMRLTAKAGDVCIWVSSEKIASRKRARGLETKQRLLLRCCVLTDTLPLVHYMRNCHGTIPKLKATRSDKIYKVRHAKPMITAQGMPSVRHPLRVFLHLTKGLPLGSVAVTNGLKDGEWEVTYNGVPSPFNCIIFSRKAHAKYQRMHTLTGRNKIGDDRRRSDFVGRALVAHNFAQFPSVEGNSGAVPWRNMRISLALGRGVRTTTLEAHPTLAAFIQELWPGAG